MRRLVVPVALLLGATLAGPVAAAFSAPVSAGTGTFTADLLEAPTGLTAGPRGCRGGVFGLLLTPSVPLSWTRAGVLTSSTSPLRGQAVAVVVGGTSFSALTNDAVTPTSTNASVYGYVDGLGLHRPLSDLTAYGLEVRTTWASWTSAPATTTHTTGLC